MSWGLHVLNWILSSPFRLPCTWECSTDSRRRKGLSTYGILVQIFRSLFVGHIGKIPINNSNRWVIMLLLFKFPRSPKIEFDWGWWILWNDCWDFAEIDFFVRPRNILIDSNFSLISTNQNSSFMPLCMVWCHFLFIRESYAAKVCRIFAKLLTSIMDPVYFL